MRPLSTRSSVHYLLLLVVLLGNVPDLSTAFAPQKRTTTIACSVASSASEATAVTDEESSLAAAEAAKSNLMETAKRLKDEYGSFLYEKEAKTGLAAAVETLESAAAAAGGSYPEFDAALFLGDWNLICTTATNNEGIDRSKSKFPSLPEPLEDIRKSLLVDNPNKFLAVVQRIRSSSSEESKDFGDGGITVDRVDNVIEFEPPKQLSDVLNNLPEQLTKFNINPLRVSKSKAILIHEASVDAKASPFSTTLSLSSIVLNVAGTSALLDPNGKDVAGLNLPFGELTNTGSFQTTYMDEEIRISRGKQGPVEQLRVFMRSTGPESENESPEEPDEDGPAAAESGGE